MSTKLILLGISVAALFAFAAPAAQASGPLLTDDLGQAASAFTAISSNTTTTTSAGTLECTTVDLKLSVSTNANTTAKGSGTGVMQGTPKTSGHAEKHTGHCGSSSGTVVEVTNVTVTEYHLKAEGGETKGTASLSYTYDLRSATGAGLIAHCTFSGTVPVKKTGARTLNVEGKIARSLGSSFFCPAEGTLKGDFTLYVFGSTVFPVTVH